MAMSKREKTLAGIVGALGAAVLGYVLLFSGPSGSLAGLQQQYEVVVGKVAKSEERRDVLEKRISANLALWNRRSLPPDPETARSLYDRWLNEQFKAVGLEGAKYESKMRVRAGAYVYIPVAVRGQATLPQLIELLHRFYSADFLHKVRSIGVKPVVGTDRLDVLLSVEALSLPTAKESEGLPKGDSGRLELKDLAAYKKAFARRGDKDEPFDTPLGFFTAYVEPPSAPGSLSARASEHSISLSWKKPETPGTRYDVYRTTGGDDEFVKLNSEPLSGDSYTDRDVKLDVRYTYRVGAIDRFGRQSRTWSTAYATPKQIVREAPKPQPKPTPSFDPTQYAFVTAILEVAGRPQVWIVARTLGETFKLFEGDRFEIGHVHGTVERIGPRSVEIEIDGRRRSVALGKRLREASNGSGDGS